MLSKAPCSSSWLIISATAARPGAATAVIPAMATGPDGAHRYRAGGDSVPRDRDASFEPKIIAKRQRLLTESMDSHFLSAKALTHGQIAAHLTEVYGAEVSKQTITTITDRVMEGIAEWQSRPLTRCTPWSSSTPSREAPRGPGRHPVRLPRVGRPDGRRASRDGLWSGSTATGYAYVLMPVRSATRTADRAVLMAVCDGPKGLPDAVTAVWEKTIVQTCIVHLLRNSFRPTAADWPMRELTRTGCPAATTAWTPRPRPVWSVPG